MKKICVYTRDGEISGSSYYRILQYTEKMKEYNIQKRVAVWKKQTQKFYRTSGGNKGFFTKLIYYSTVYFITFLFMIWDYINKPECVIILRSITPKIFLGPLAWIYKKLLKKTKVIWDFDDNIVESNEISSAEFDALASYSNKIFVTNGELRSLLPHDSWDKIILLPTTDGDFRDYILEDLNRKRLEIYDNEIRLVWVASSSNLKYLKLIINILDSTAEELNNIYNKKLVLDCVCNKPLDSHCSSLIINNIMWSRKSAVKYICKDHIGLMPLEDSIFTRGKGGFKLVQYMAAGMPTIGTAVGFNNEVTKHTITGYLIPSNNDKNVWKSAIIELSTKRKKWIDMSNSAKERWNDIFNYEKNLAVWYKIIEEVCD